MSMSVSTPVEVSIEVQASVEEAFDVFTEDMGSWWPADHHILQAELAEMVFEPRVGGQIIDKGVDGSECPWARVLVYDPPTSAGVLVGHHVDMADRNRPVPFE